MWTFGIRQDAELRTPSLLQSRSVLTCDVVDQGWRTTLTDDQWYWNVVGFRYWALTKQCERYRHHWDDYKHPSPRWQWASATERCKQGGLDPTSGHVAQVSETAEHSSTGPKLRLLVPRTINEMRPDATDMSVHIRLHPGEKTQGAAY